MKNKTAIMLAGAAVLIVALFIVGKPGTAPSGAVLSRAVAPGVLVATENRFDFGTVSMAAGKVTHTFVVKNGGAVPQPLTRFYTSCMCTEATLIQGEKRMGPVGMAGHSVVPRWNLTFAPGEEVRVEVAFDPAAHGPAGIGAIAREVRLDSDAGTLLTLGIAANVTP
ncbi:MAG: DUF1573 domain-containing protein [Candidatus Jorgensenbacteria bacterium]